MAAGLAAVRMTSTDLKRLNVLQERMETHQSLGELDSYFEINQQIHQLVMAGVCADDAVTESRRTKQARLSRQTAAE